MTEWRCSVAGNEGIDPGRIFSTGAELISQNEIVGVNVVVHEVAEGCWRDKRCQQCRLNISEHGEKKSTINDR
jgi:hypothetical protein